MSKWAGAHKRAEKNKAKDPFFVAAVKPVKCPESWSHGLVHPDKNGIKTSHVCPGDAGHAGPCVCRCGAARPPALIDRCADCGGEHTVTEPHCEVKVR